MKSAHARGVQIIVKLALVALLLFGGAWVGWADDKYYVQLIKATNEADPPKKGARAVGAKIGEQLSPLRWKHYWEMERRDALIPTGKTRKIQLSGERSVEVVPTDNGKVEVRLYRGKQLARKSCHKPDNRLMAIFGGDEGAHAWFIVVRREEPNYEVARN